MNWQQACELPYYNGTDLGANYTPAATTFKLWAPTAAAVTVELFRKPDALTVRIENTGKVLPPDFVDNLGRPMTSSKTGGLGYGILIAITILESNKGSVRFQRNPDGGLCVSVGFPLFTPSV